MPVNDPAIRVRWRRLQAGVQAVRDAVAARSADEAVPDALAGALDALYDLVEALKSAGGLTNAGLEDLADGDPRAAAVVGLVWARGSKTHKLADFGDLYTYGSHGYGEGPYGGGWAWQPYEDEGTRYPRRAKLYAERVRGRRVLDPFEDALVWLAERSELSVG